MGGDLWGRCSRDLGHWRAPHSPAGHREGSSPTSSPATPRTAHGFHHVLRASLRRESQRPVSSLPVTFLSVCDLLLCRDLPLSRRSLLEGRWRRGLASWPCWWPLRRRDTDYSRSMSRGEGPGEQAVGGPGSLHTPGEQARPGPGPAGSGGVAGAAGLPQGLGLRGPGFWARQFLWARPWVLDRSLRVFTLKLSVSTSLPSLSAFPVPASPFAQWSADALLAAPGATWSGLALRLWAAAGMLSQDSRVFGRKGLWRGQVSLVSGYFICNSLVTHLRSTDPELLGNPTIKYLQFICCCICNFFKGMNIGVLVCVCVGGGGGWGGEFHRKFLIIKKTHVPEALPTTSSPRPAAPGLV